MRPFLHCSHIKHSILVHSTGRTLAGTTGALVSPCPPAEWSACSGGRPEHQRRHATSDQSRGHRRRARGRSAAADSVNLAPDSRLCKNRRRQRRKLLATSLLLAGAAAKPVGRVSRDGTAGGRHALPTAVRKLHSPLPVVMSSSSEVCRALPTAVCRQMAMCVPLFFFC